MIDNMGPRCLGNSCYFMMTMTTPNAGSGSNESHVDRAMRGPTPDNPSLSLKKRMKRAAFFDQREREVAAGEAEPVDADAGLPERMVEEAAEEAAMDLADALHEQARLSA
jgi:hypothetical protein